MTKKNRFWAEGRIHAKQLSWPLPHTRLFSNRPAMNRICRLHVEEEARSLHVIWQVDWVWQRLSSLLFIWKKIQNMLQAPRHAFRVAVDWRDLIFPLHRIVWTQSTKHSLGNQSSKNTFKRGCDGEVGVLYGLTVDNTMILTTEPAPLAK